MSNPLNSFDYPQSPGNEPQTVSDATNIHHNLVRGMHDVMIGYNSVITTYNQNISRYLSTIDEYRQDLNIARNHGNPTSIPSTPIRPRRHIRPRSSPMRHNTNTSFPQTPIYKYIVSPNTNIWNYSIYYIYFSDIIIFKYIFIANPK